VRGLASGNAFCLLIRPEGERTLEIERGGGQQPSDSAPEEQLACKSSLRNQCETHRGGVDKSWGGELSLPENVRRLPNPLRIDRRALPGGCDS